MAAPYSPSVRLPWQRRAGESCRVADLKDTVATLQAENRVLRKMLSQLLQTAADTGLIPRPSVKGGERW